jgi:hypothetical protein
MISNHWIKDWTIATTGLEAWINSERWIRAPLSLLTQLSQLVGSFQHLKSVLHKMQKLALSQLRAGRSGVWTRWGQDFYILYTRPDRPRSQTSLVCNWYQVSFPGVKRPGRSVDHPPILSTEFQERLKLYLYMPPPPPPEPSWPVIGRTLPFTFN